MFTTMLKDKILRMLWVSPMTINQIAKALNIDKVLVAYHVLQMVKEREIQKIQYTITEHPTASKKGKAEAVFMAAERCPCLFETGHKPKDHSKPFDDILSSALSRHKIC